MARGWTGRSRGGHLGNLFYVWLIRAGGLSLVPFFLFWTSLWFLLAAPRSRRVSFDLARRLGCGDTALARWRFARGHFFTFATLLADRVAILNGQAHRYRFSFQGEDEIAAALAGGRGVVLVTAHLGNWEVMGHLLQRLGRPIQLVMSDGVSPAMRRTLDEMSKERSFQVLFTDGSPASAAAILAALRRGEVVGMMGDRVNKGRSVAVDVLGAPAELPVAPWVLSAASGAPLLHVFCVREGARSYGLHAFPTEPPAKAGRAEREAELTRCASAFAARLDAFLRAHPRQWGNFYAFWS